MKTLIELFHQSRVNKPSMVSDMPFGEQTASFTEEVTFPRLLGQTLALNESTYHQVERTGRIAIYEGPQSGMFEVIVIQVKPPGVCPSGAVVPFREVYPVAESWGTYGWTFTSASHPDPLQAARERVKGLVAGVVN